MIATGVSAEGLREVLGFDVGDSEDEVFWRGFLTRRLSHPLCARSAQVPGPPAQATTARDLAASNHWPTAVVV